MQPLPGIIADDDVRNDSKYGLLNTIVNGNRIHSERTIEKMMKEGRKMCGDHREAVRYFTDGVLLSKIHIVIVLSRI